MPIHRWFHYYAGFSAQWLGGLLRERSGSGRLRVLDPFAGSGTALIEAERAGAEAIGLEPHPFISRVARVKLLWREDAGGFARYCEGLVADARTRARERWAGEYFIAALLRSGRVRGFWWRSGRLG